MALLAVLPWIKKEIWPQALQQGDSPINNGDVLVIVQSLALVPMPIIKLVQFPEPDKVNILFVVMWLMIFLQSWNTKMFP